MKQYLEDIVKKLAVPGLRNANNNTWEVAMEMMHSLILETGFKPDIKEWQNAEKNKYYRNFSVLINGKNKRRIIIGAHYDTFENTPGADDNASAVAVLLGILKSVDKNHVPEFTIECVFYACEEQPFFGTENMGSFIHAKNIEAEDVECMICLEMVGYFTNEKNTQDYPLSLLKWIFGTKGNFLIGVSNFSSARKSIKMMNKLKKIRPGFYKKLILPFFFSGMDWSDHRSYWNKKIPAIMLTDTAMFRNSNYHTEKDVYTTLNYGIMENLVADLTFILK